MLIEKQSKKELYKGWRGPRKEVSILDRMARKGFIEKVTFKYRPKGDEGASLADV